MRKHMEAELALGASQKEGLRLKQHAERVDYGMQALSQKLRVAEKVRAREHVGRAVERGRVAAS